MRFHDCVLPSLGLATMLAAGYGCAEAAEQPNIIMFLVDDMGWQDTSVPFYNDTTSLNRRFHTPNMERLAQMGVKFTEAYACAVSSPTRCSLLSGMNASRHRVTNWTLEYDQKTDARSKDLNLPDWNYNGIQPDTVTSAYNTNNTTLITPLPRLLRDNGYYTIHCGKAHFGARTTPGANPLTMGFDVNIAGGANGGPGSYLGTENFGASNPRFAVQGLDKYFGQDVFLTEVLTIEAIEALKKPIADGQPFFLYMSHYAVHVPLSPDKRFMGNYVGQYDEQLQDTLDLNEVKYAALVEGMDKSLGDLLDFLEAQPEVAANTIILFMSDNGGYALGTVRQGVPNRDPNYPARAGKGSAFMGGVREPMMVYWPGVTEGGTVNSQRVMIEDFFPSILDMAGVTQYETRQTVDGYDFVPLLRGDVAAYERPIVWHFPNLWGEAQSVEEGYGAYSAILSGDYHLIYSWSSGRLRLFNIKEDIGEQNDIAADNRDVVKRLAHELSQYLRERDAQRPGFKATGELCPWPDEVQF